MQKILYAIFYITVDKKRSELTIYKNQKIISSICIMIYIIEL